MSQRHASKRKRYPNEDGEVLNKVANHIITKETLSEKLAQHVEQVSSFTLFSFISFHKGHEIISCNISGAQKVTDQIY